MAKSVSVLRLSGMPSLRQMQLEEALLRTDKRNFCVLATDVPGPTVVLGISARVKQLVNVDLVRRDGVPLVKRFSGGGTVVVDPRTVVMSFICNNEVLPFGPPVHPRPLMEWAREFYHPVFQRPNHPEAAVIEDKSGHSPAVFGLRENDFVFGEQKFGGNAQYITKWRFVHHTSFLWDYDSATMKYLSLPDRRPDYRRDRDHSEFLGKLKDYMHPMTKDCVMDRVVERLGDYFEQVDVVSVDDVIDSIDTEHIKNTALLDADAYA